MLVDSSKTYNKSKVAIMSSVKAYDSPAFVFNHGGLIMILMDLYKKGQGVIKNFPSVNTEQETKDFIESYCKENNVHVVAREWCGDAYWNYLSDGTEIDYCFE